MNSHLLLAQDSIPPAPPYPEGSLFFPQQASSFARDIDWMYDFIYWICVIFFAIIVGVMVWFVIKYRRRPGVDPLPSPHHNTTLEIAWSVLPGLLLVLMFKWGAEGFFDQRIPFDDAELIRVKASQFNWLFEYEDGDFSQELHLTRNQPYEFRLESADVLHSFFIPVFRQKMDIVPGRYTTMWVRATATGTFRVYCAEYCGDNHSNMKTNVIVHETEAERKDATKWDFVEKSQTAQGRIENGQRLFAVRCSGCHSVSGKPMTGPNLDGRYGQPETLEDGTTVTVDDNYIRESILEPQAKIVQGFGPPNQKMQSFQGELNDEQIDWLIEYVKSIGPDAGTATTTETAN